MLDNLDILYELTIFALFIILFSRIFRSYALPYIYTTINDIKQRQVDLKNKNNLTRSTLQRVRKKLEIQNSDLLLLEKKLKVWHSKLIDKEIEAKAINEQIIEKISKKRDKQKENFCLNKVKNEVIPKAVILAEKYFIEHSKDTGRVILKKLISRLEEKIV